MMSYLSVNSHLFLRTVFSLQQLGFPEQTGVGQTKLVLTSQFLKNPLSVYFNEARLQ